MDTWKFFDITHHDHTICNPLSLSKFGYLMGLVPLPSGARVIDIASGKGEFIVQLAERSDISGLGIDISPYCIADARAKLKARVPAADIRFLEMNGADFKPDEPESFDLAACLGASWIFDGHRGTLEALISMTKPGGLIVVGEPHWLQEPAAVYLEAAGFERETFGTHLQNVATGESLGLTLLYSLVSNHDDWDQYEGLQWLAAEQYAQDHPDDPDVTELLQRVDESKHEYLKWGREALGWAVYVFKKP